MPGTFIGRDELDHAAVAQYQEMGGNPERAQLLEIRMSVIIQAIAEQVGNIVAAKLARRQADVMNHQQIRHTTIWPRIAVGRRLAHHFLGMAPAVCTD